MIDPQVTVHWINASLIKHNVHCTNKGKPKKPDTRFHCLTLEKPGTGAASVQCNIIKEPTTAGPMNDRSTKIG